MLNNKLKELALKMQLLSPKDRKWLLSNLPTDQRKKVDLLLVELSSIRAVDNKDIITDFLNSKKQDKNKKQDKYVQSESRTLREFSSFIKILDNKSADEMFRVLSNEKPWVNALVLGAYHWKWTTEFNKLLSPNLKSQIVRCQLDVNNSVKDAVKHAVLSVIVELLNVDRSNNIDSDNLNLELVFDTQMTVPVGLESKYSDSWWQKKWR